MVQSPTLRLKLASPGCSTGKPPKEINVVSEVVIVGLPWVFLHVRWGTALTWFPESIFIFNFELYTLADLHHQFSEVFCKSPIF